jgi:hypothetical protein
VGTRLPYHLQEPLLLHDLSEAALEAREVAAREAKPAPEAEILALEQVQQKA